MERKILRYGMALLLSVFCIGAFCACGQEPAKQTTQIKTVAASKTMAMEKEYDMELTGVIKKIEEDAETITVLETATAAETILTYNDMTEAVNKYGDIKTIGQFSIGDIVQVFFWSKNNEIVKIKNSDMAWNYEDVKKFSIRREDQIFKIVDHRYQYDPVSLLVIQDGKLTDLLAVNDYDTLSIQGVGSRIYSITVTKGHGYVRFKNYEQFVGGMVEIGYGIIRNVSEDMLLTVPEGTYRMVMEHGRLLAEKQITVEQGQELTVDLSAYQTKVDKTGRVYFMIDPEGAQLNVNGVPVVYTDAVELNFGKNIIQVFADGHMSYTGTLNVKKAYQVVKIHLAEDGSEAEVVSTSDEADSGTETQTENNNTNNTGNNTENNTQNNNSDNSNNNNNSNNGSSNNSSDSNSDSNSNSTNTNTNNDSNNNNTEETSNNDNQSNTSNDSSAAGQNKEQNSEKTDKTKEEQNNKEEESTGDTTIESADTGTTEIDKKHTITVNSPAKVKVYVNGDYIGKSPVSFPKIIGTFTIALSQNGYKTASYTLTMEDDKESCFLSFPDLVEEES